jgi:hypothetical protein
MIPTPAAAKITQPETGDSAFIRTGNQAFASPARVKAQGHADMPTLLSGAGTPLENLQPSNLKNGTITPLEPGVYQ